VGAKSIGEHSQRIRGAWALPMVWALSSVHVALGLRWVGDKWRLGHG